MVSSSTLPPSLRLPRTRWPVADRIEAARLERAATAGVRDDATPETFRAFVERVNPRFEFYPHCVTLIDALQRVADGEIERLMVFEPPRHGKSELVSRLFPAYYLHRYPGRFFGLCSYAAELAYTFSRNARDNFRHAGGALKDDAAAVKQWETGKGGGLWAAGVGGPITGKGFHLGSIDDPLKNAEDAQSETIRRKQWDWYQSTFLTREEPGAAQILTLTRWHEDDLAGRVIEQARQTGEVWHVLVLEAVKTAEPPDLPAHFVVLGDDARAEGEALCPARYDEAKLARIRQRIGPYYWGALYQQKPTPKEGTTFKVEKLRYVDADEVPPLTAVCRGWDLGATEGGGDHTAGVKVGRGADGLFYVLDVVRGQWESAGRNRKKRETAEQDGKAVTVHLPQDPGQAGKDQAKMLTQLLAGFPVKVEPVTGSKEVRAEPLAAQVNAGSPDEPGNVRLVRGHWNAAFVEELRAFPHGPDDDQVDAAADAFDEVAEAAWLFT